MKLVQGSLSLRKDCCNQVLPLLWSCEVRAGQFGCRKDAESSFHHSVDIVKLVHACLNFRMDCKDISFTTVEVL